MIVKIQRSLFSSDKESMLIYDRSRSMMIQQPMHPLIKKQLGECEKAYFKARRHHDGTLVIQERVTNQDW